MMAYRAGAMLPCCRAAGPNSDRRRARAVLYVNSFAAIPLVSGLIALG
jgi:hypothetical protein